ncbi:unnamed protein product, partial [Polarella glacialis]
LSSRRFAAAGHPSLPDPRVAVQRRATPGRRPKLLGQLPEESSPPEDSEFWGDEDASMVEARWFGQEQQAPKTPHCITHWPQWQQQALVPLHGPEEAEDGQEYQTRQFYEDNDEVEDEDQGWDSGSR